ncbi:MAG: carboxymuconolactone decarboxylase family protein [Nitriliruptoraceae bacterium]
MPDDYKQYLKDYQDTTGKLREELPEVMKTFGGLHGATMSDGALDAKTKELIALGMGITGHCEGCIAVHVAAAAKAGATREELMEVIGVAILMNGGPATVYGGEAYKAIEALT